MLIEKDEIQNQRLIIRLLIACGAVGPLLFIVVFLIEGATRPGYSAWRNFVSSLSLGNQGWEQIANFIVCGVLSLCFAVGLRQVLRRGKGSIGGPVLLGVFGLALVVAGVFVTGPGISFFPGTPAISPATIHGVSGIFVFGCLSAACFVLARRFVDDPAWRGWRTYSVITGIIVAVFFVVSIAFSVLDEKGIFPDAPGGLLQRIAIIAGWGWVALLSIQLLRKTGSPLARQAGRL
jgi:hypothetical protein